MATKKATKKAVLELNGVTIEIRLKGSIAVSDVEDFASALPRTALKAFNRAIDAHIEKEAENA